MTRKQALAALKVAGAQNDRKMWIEMYVANRVSLRVANEQWAEGQSFARFIAARDAAKTPEASRP